jgi:hypothetical protein
MSLDVESRLALARDEPAVVEFLSELDANVQTDLDDDAVRWLTLHPRSSPSEIYIARIIWSVYPHREPSVLFTDSVRGALGVQSAWPNIAGYRAPNDICMPFTVEGFNTHNEWRSGPQAWSALGNPYLRAVVQLQDDFDHRYQGRAG